MFDHIQLIAEPSAELETALAFATEMTRRSGGQLHIIDVLPRVPRRKQAALEAEMIDLVIEHARQRGLRLAARARETLGTADRVHLEAVESDTRWYALAMETVRRPASLVVVPADATDGAAPFGSISHHLFRKSPRPVLAVQATPTAVPRRILAAVDPGWNGSDQRVLAQAVLREATSLAALCGAELHVVHAWKLWGEAAIASHYGASAVRKYLQGAEEEARVLLSQVLDAIGSSSIPRELHVRKGDPEVVVPGLARQLGADLVVTGTAARTGLQGFLIGSKAESILGRLSCSAMAVKPPGFISPLAI